MRILLLSLLTLLTLATQPAHALGNEELLSAYRQGDCVVLMLADRKSRMLRLRTRNDQTELCDIRFETLDAVLRDGLDKLPQHIRWNSFYLGRAVEHRWLSRGLAEAALFDERWDAERGTSRAGHPNRLVAELLASPGLMHRIYPVFQQHGFRIRAVGVEKVLGMDYHQLAGDGNQDQETCAAEATVPFDAQVWLQLQQTHNEENQP